MNRISVPSRHTVLYAQTHTYLHRHSLTRMHALGYIIFPKGHRDPQNVNTIHSKDIAIIASTFFLTGTPRLRLFCLSLRLCLCVCVPVYVCAWLCFYRTICVYISTYKYHISKSAQQNLVNICVYTRDCVIYVL